MDEASPGVHTEAEGVQVGTSPDLSCLFDPAAVAAAAAALARAPATSSSVPAWDPTPAAPAAPTFLGHDKRADIKPTTSSTGATQGPSWAAELQAWMAPFPTSSVTQTASLPPALAETTFRGGLSSSAPLNTANIAPLLAGSGAHPKPPPLHAPPPHSAPPPPPVPPTSQAPSLQEQPCPPFALPNQANSALPQPVSAAPFRAMPPLPFTAPPAQATAVFPQPNTAALHAQALQMLAESGLGSLLDQASLSTGHSSLGGGGVHPGSATHEANAPGTLAGTPGEVAAAASITPGVAVQGRPSAAVPMPPPPPPAAPPKVPVPTPPLPPPAPASVPKPPATPLHTTEVPAPPLPSAPALSTAQKPPATAPPPPPPPANMPMPPAPAAAAAPSVTQKAQAPPPPSHQGQAQVPVPVQSCAVSHPPPKSSTAAALQAQVLQMLDPTAPHGLPFLQQQPPPQQQQQQQQQRSHFSQLQHHDHHLQQQQDQQQQQEQQSHFPQLQHHNHHLQQQQDQQQHQQLQQLLHHQLLQEPHHRRHHHHQQQQQQQQQLEQQQQQQLLRQQQMLLPASGAQPGSSSNIHSSGTIDKDFFSQQQLLLSSLAQPSHRAPSPTGSSLQERGPPASFPASLTAPTAQLLTSSWGVSSAAPAVSSAAGTAAAAAAAAAGSASHNNQPASVSLCGGGPQSQMPGLMTQDLAPTSQPFDNPMGALSLLPGLSSLGSPPSTGIPGNAGWDSAMGVAALLMNPAAAIAALQQQLLLHLNPRQSQSQSQQQSQQQEPRQEQKQEQQEQHQEQQQQQHNQQHQKQPLQQQQQQQQQPPPLSKQQQQQQQQQQQPQKQQQKQVRQPPQPKPQPQWRIRQQLQRQQQQAERRQQRLAQQQLLQAQQAANSNHVNSSSNNCNKNNGSGVRGGSGRGVRRHKRWAVPQVAPPSDCMGIANGAGTAPNQSPVQCQSAAAQTAGDGSAGGGHTQQRQEGSQHPSQQTLLPQEQHGMGAQHQVQLPNSFGSAMAAGGVGAAGAGTGGRRVPVPPVVIAPAVCAADGSGEMPARKSERQRGPRGFARAHSKDDIYAWDVDAGPRRARVPRKRKRERAEGEGVVAGRRRGVRSENGGAEGGGGFPGGEEEGGSQQALEPPKGKEGAVEWEAEREEEEGEEREGEDGGGESEEEDLGGEEGEGVQLAARKGSEEEEKGGNGDQGGEEEESNKGQGGEQGVKRSQGSRVRTRIPNSRRRGSGRRSRAQAPPSPTQQSTPRQPGAPHPALAFVGCTKALSHPPPVAVACQHSAQDSAGHPTPSKHLAPASTPRHSSDPTTTSDSQPAAEAHAHDAATTGDNTSAAPDRPRSRASAVPGTGAAAVAACSQPKPRRRSSQPRPSRPRSTTGGARAPAASGSRVAAGARRPRRPSRSRTGAGGSGSSRRARRQVKEEQEDQEEARQLALQQQAEEEEEEEQMLLLLLQQEEEAQACGEEEEEEGDAGQAVPVFVGHNKRTPGLVHVCAFEATGEHERGSTGTGKGTDGPGGVEDKGAKEKGAKGVLVEEGSGGEAALRQLCTPVKASEELHAARQETDGRQAAGQHQQQQQQLKGGADSALHAATPAVGSALAADAPKKGCGNGDDVAPSNSPPHPPPQSQQKELHKDVAGRASPQQLTPRPGAARERKPKPLLQTLNSHTGALTDGPGGSYSGLLKLPPVVPPPPVKNPPTPAERLLHAPLPVVSLDVPDITPGDSLASMLTWLRDAACAIDQPGLDLPLFGSYGKRYFALAWRARALETHHTLDHSDPLASPSNLEGIRPLEGGEQRWQQRDDLFRVSMRPRQGGAIAKSQQSAYGQKPSHAFLFVGSRYQAQVAPAPLPRPEQPSEEELAMLGIPVLSPKQVLEEEETLRKVVAARKELQAAEQAAAEQAAAAAGLAVAAGGTGRSRAGGRGRSRGGGLGVHGTRRGRAATPAELRREKAAATAAARAAAKLRAAEAAAAQAARVMAGEAEDAEGERDTNEEDEAEAGEEEEEAEHQAGGGKAGAGRSWRGRAGECALAKERDDALAAGTLCALVGGAAVAQGGIMGIEVKAAAARCSGAGAVEALVDGQAGERAQGQERRGRKRRGADVKREEGEEVQHGKGVTSVSPEPMAGVVEGCVPIEREVKRVKVEEGNAATQHSHPFAAHEDALAQPVASAAAAGAELPAAATAAAVAAAVSGEPHIAPDGVAAKEDVKGGEGMAVDERPEEKVCGGLCNGEELQQQEQQQCRQDLQGKDRQSKQQLTTQHGGQQSAQQEYQEEHPRQQEVAHQGEQQHIQAQQKEHQCQQEVAQQSEQQHIQAQWEEHQRQQEGVLEGAQQGEGLRQLALQSGEQQQADHLQGQQEEQQQQQQQQQLELEQGQQQQQQQELELEQQLKQQQQQLEQGQGLQEKDDQQQLEGGHCMDAAATAGTRAGGRSGVGRVRRGQQRRHVQPLPAQSQQQQHQHQQEDELEDADEQQQQQQQQQVLWPPGEEPDGQLEVGRQKKQQQQQQQQRPSRRQQRCEDLQPGEQDGEQQRRRSGSRRALRPADPNAPPKKPRAAPGEGIRGIRRRAALAAKAAADVFNPFLSPPHQGLCKEVTAKLNAAPNLNARHAVMDATVLEMDENLLGPNLVKALSMESLGSKVKASWTPVEEDAFVAGLRQHNREFQSIQRDFLPEKSIAQIIDYYYNIWKIRYTDASVQWHLEHWTLKEARAAEEEAAAKQQKQQQQQQQQQQGRQQQGGRCAQRQHTAQPHRGKAEERAAKREGVTGEGNGVM